MIAPWIGRAIRALRARPATHATRRRIAALRRELSYRTEGVA